MSFWDEYETDTEAENNGRWLNLKGGLSLKIARADVDSNVNFAKKLQDLQADPKNADESNAAASMIELYAGLVTDCKNLVTKKGEKLKYSNKNIIDLFIALPEIYKLVKLYANNFDNYKAVRAADDLKKS